MTWAPSLAVALQLLPRHVWITFAFLSRVPRTLRVVLVRRCIQKVITCRALQRRGGEIARWLAAFKVSLRYEGVPGSQRDTYSQAI